MKSVLRTGACALAIASAWSVAAPALAQQAEQQAAQLEEIVITAQRRSEDLQRAALAVTAVTGEALEQRGITNAYDLTNVTAGMQVTTSAGPYTTFTVRSVSNLGGNAFADPAVALNFAGVYFATPTTVQGLFYDLERVEILKGPQGTLYGRNATAGAINVVPKRPDLEAFGGDIGVDIGNFDKVNVNGAVNLPLTDSLAARAAFQAVSRDGYYSDGTGDEDVQSARASLLWQLSEGLSINLIADWTQLGGKGPGASLRRDCGGGTVCFPLGEWTGIGNSQALYTAAGIATQNPNPYNDSTFWGVAANIDWQVLGGTLTIIPAYRESDVAYLSQATSWTLTERQRPKQSSLEARFASGGEGPISYILGAYYLATEMQARANGESAAGGTFSDQHTSTEGWTAAGFGQLTWSISDALRFTGGLRYTFEEKSTNSRRYNVRTVGPNFVIPAVPTTPPTSINIQTKDWDKVNWKAGLEWDVAEQSLLYANVSTGFKAGGFFYGVPGADTYQPEELTAYVIGSKNRFLDNRLQVNAEAYYYNYENQQLSFIKLVNNSSVLVTENVGQVTSKGVELEAIYLPFDNTRLGLQLNWLDAQYDQFIYNSPAPPPAGTQCLVAPSAGQFRINCTGLTPLRSPEWTVVFAAEQTFPLASGASLVGEMRVRYEDAFEADVVYIPLTKTYSTTRLDLALTYREPNERWSVRAYVNNVTDEVTIAQMQTHNAFARTMFSGTTLQPPRTYGVRFNAAF
jgi:iron complex outermembrane recepter protein